MNILTSNILDALATGAMTLPDLATLTRQPEHVIRPAIVALQKAGRIEQDGHRHVRRGGCCVAEALYCLPVRSVVIMPGTESISDPYPDRPPCPKCGRGGVIDAYNHYCDGTRQARYRCLICNEPFQKYPRIRDASTHRGGRPVVDGTYPPCPRCESTSTRKGNKELSRGEPVQTYRCKNCDRQFTPRRETLHNPPRLQQA